VPNAPRGGELARRLSELEGLASEDDLTGLANRRHWLQTVRGILAERGSGTVAVIDIDGLKTVNERHGTGVGDIVLTELARIVPRYGRAGRIGGDEIALFAEHPMAAVEAVASTIARAVTDAFAELGGQRVTLSIGIAAAPDHGSELAAVLEAAEGALWAAKRAGGSAIVCAGGWRRSQVAA
jgi:diguanylate cyclase (GGDEF)-like protein